MAKPRRTTKQEFYDVFSDFPIEDQAVVLEFLSEIHRMAKRRAPTPAKAPPAPPCVTCNGNGVVNPDGTPGVAGFPPLINKPCSACAPPKPNGAPQPVVTLLDDQPDEEAIR